MGSFIACQYCILPLPDSSSQHNDALRAVPKVGRSFRMEDGMMVSRDLKLTRRAALQGAAAAGLIHRGPAIAAPAVHSDTKLTVTGYFRTPAFLIAAQRGLFTQESLDVEFHLVRLAPEHNKGLAEGRWPLTLSSIDTMLARTTQMAWTLWLSW